MTPPYPAPEGYHWELNSDAMYTYTYDLKKTPPPAEMWPWLDRFLNWLTRNNTHGKG